MKKILSIIAICGVCCTAQARDPRPYSHHIATAAYYKAERAERRADEARRIATVATVVAVVAVTIGIVEASRNVSGHVRLASF